MKHIIFSFILFLSFTQITKAQLRVASSDGQVTVGSTNNAADELDVYGDVRIRHEAGSDEAILRFDDGTGVNGAAGNVIGSMYIELTGNDYHINMASGYDDMLIECNSDDIVIDAEDELRFQTNDVLEMMITKAGLVGINTAVPTEELEVAGDAQISGNNPFLRFKKNNADDNDESGLHWKDMADAEQFRIFYNYLADRMYFGPNTNETQSHLTIENSSGFIGVNTSNPEHQLHVEGNGFYDGDITFDGPEYLNWEEAGTRKAYMFYNGLNLFMENDETGGDIFIDPKDDLFLQTDGATRLSINELGDVGINTTAPTERLHVNGGLRIGNAANTANGTIRYNGTDLEGRVAGEWKSLTQAGGGAGVWSTAGTTTYYSGGNVAIGTNSAVQELAVAGDIGLTGEIVGISDARVKKNIHAISNATDIVNALNPVSYEYRTDHFNNMSLPEGKQFGLIAQEVEQVIPDMVTAHSSANGMDLKGINYNELIPVLTKALQEQSSLIKTQQKMLEDQQKQIDELKALHK